MQFSLIEKPFSLSRIFVVLLMASVVGCSESGSLDEERTVTLQISGVKDHTLRDRIAAQLPGLVEHSSPSMTSDWTDETMTVELSPVENIEELAGRIEFGDARVVGTRTIVVEVETENTTDVTVTNLGPTPSQPPAESTPLPPYDAEKVAEKLREAGAPRVLVNAGKLTEVSFFRAKSPVTDETFKFLIDEHGRTPAHLSTLSLFGGEITDDGLEIIAKIPSIESLNLVGAGSGISDAGVDLLIEGLPNLRVLALSNSSLTDDGLKSISTLSNLNQLVIERTAIGDDGLAHLRNLPELEYLKLAGTKVTDSGLVHLATLPKLKHLTLAQTEITGADAIEHLKKLTKLEYLTVPRENFEDEHYEALKAAIPKLWK